MQDKLDTGLINSGKFAATSRASGVLIMIFSFPTERSTRLGFRARAGDGWKYQVVQDEAIFLLDHLDVTLDKTEILQLYSLIKQHFRK